MSQRLRAVVRQQGAWWLGSIEGLPGSSTQGESRAETVAALEQALRKAAADNPDLRSAQLEVLTITDDGPQPDVDVAQRDVSQARPSAAWQGLSLALWAMQKTWDAVVGLLMIGLGLIVQAPIAGGAGLALAGGLNVPPEAAFPGAFIAWNLMVGAIYMRNRRLVQAGRAVPIDTDHYHEAVAIWLLVPRGLDRIFTGCEFGRSAWRPELTPLRRDVPKT